MPYNYFSDFEAPHSNDAPTTGAPPTNLGMNEINGGQPIHVTAPYEGQVQEPPGLTSGMGDNPAGQPTGDGGGGNWFTNWLGMNGGSGMNGGASNFFGLTPQTGSQLALLAGAYNDWQNSGKYMDMATKYADKMDPFGGQRGHYQDQLRQLEDDPNGYLANSPDYQAALRQGLGAVNRQTAANGTFGTGTGNVDVMNYASDTAAKYLDRDRQSLMTMAGAQIGPGAAEDLIKTGLNGSINAQNNALTNLTRALFPESKSSYTNITNGGGPGGGSGYPPGSIQDTIAQALAKSGPAGYAGMMQQLMKAGMTQQQAEQLIQQSGGGVTQGPDTGQTPYQGDPNQGGIQYLGPGQGWFDPSSGTYYDDNGNVTYAGGDGGGGGFNPMDPYSSYGPE